MLCRPLPLVLATSAALTLVVSCGSPAKTSAQAPIQPADEPSFVIDAPGLADAVADGIVAELDAEVDPFGPKPWTGAFTETAIMLTRSIRIEGPEGLLDHVVASSDDEYYERTIETTPEGLLQTVRRLGKDAPEIRVRLDRWTIAVEDSVVILETIAPGPVKVIASGNALWRDVDGHLAQAERLEFVGQIGFDTPVRPLNTHAPEQTQDTDPSSAAVESVESATSELEDAPVAEEASQGDEGMAPVSTEESSTEGAAGSTEGPAAPAGGPAAPAGGTAAPDGGIESSNVPAGH